MLSRGAAVLGSHGRCQILGIMLVAYSPVVALVCETCGGTGRVAGGLGAFFDWAPKAYRPCPECEKRGKQIAGRTGEVGVSTTDSERSFLFEGGPQGDLTITLAQDPGLYVSSLDGTGAVAWGSSYVLADLLQRQGVPLAVAGGQLEKTKPLEGCRVLELGAGTGLVSMVCSRLGAEVAATDGSDKVLGLLSKNAAANRRGEEDKEMTVRRLEWGTTVDWVESFQPEVVVLADVFYSANSGSWPALIETLQSLSWTEGKGPEARRFPTVVWAHAARDDGTQFESPDFAARVLNPLRATFAISEVDRALLHPAYTKSNVRVVVLNPGERR